MKYLVTGVTGYLGARVARRLVERRDSVVGLVRTRSAASAVEALGIEPLVGGLGDAEVLSAAARRVDGVIHTAFDHRVDFSVAVAEERAAMNVLLASARGSGKLVVGSTATGVLGNTGPAAVDESFSGDPGFPARFRMEVERDILASVSEGVRAVVIRPAILVHGHGASQFVPALVDAARKSTRAAYVGDGRNRIASVHVDDLADLYILAVDSAPAGAVYNAAGGDTSMRELAEAIATGNPGVRPESVSAADARALWNPFLAMLAAIDNRVLADRARRELLWEPYRHTPALTVDVTSGSYAPRAAAREGGTT